MACWGNEEKVPHPVYVVFEIIFTKTNLMQSLSHGSQARALTPTHAVGFSTGRDSATHWAKFALFAETKSSTPQSPVAQQAQA